MSFLLFILATVGLSRLVVDSKLGEKIKLRLGVDRLPWLAELTSCYQCSGFWAGLLCGGLAFGFGWTVLLCGFAGSFLAPLANDLDSLLQQLLIGAYASPSPELPSEQS